MKIRLSRRNQNQQIDASTVLPVDTRKMNENQNTGVIQRSQLFHFIYLRNHILTLMICLKTEPFYQQTFQVFFINSKPQNFAEIHKILAPQPNGKRSGQSNEIRVESQFHLGGSWGQFVLTQATNRVKSPCMIGLSWFLPSSAFSSVGPSASLRASYEHFLYPFCPKLNCYYPRPPKKVQNRFKLGCLELCLNLYSVFY